MKIKVDLNIFDLPFMRNPYELMDNVTDDTNFQARSEMALQMMEKMIPKSAIFLGGTGNWEDEYEKCFYLIRNEPNNSLQWAVFSIGWNPKLEPMAVGRMGAIKR